MKRESVGWIQTHSRKRFSLLNPDPESVDILDIAHSLSHQCRFLGHVEKFYSVAQHSVLVSLLCPSELALWGLLHDAAEAYIGDMPMPLKCLPEMEEYRKVEAGVMLAVCTKFKLPLEEPGGVIEVDQRLLATEARDLLQTDAQRDWGHRVPPFGEGTIEPCWSSSLAYAKFLARYSELIRS